MSSSHENLFIPKENFYPISDNLRLNYVFIFQGQFWAYDHILENDRRKGWSSRA